MKNLLLYFVGGLINGAFWAFYTELLGASGYICMLGAASTIIIIPLIVNDYFASPENP